MCILFIYTNPNPQKGNFRLIVASNRDEFYKRPAKKAFLCEETAIIGGRDMEPGREGGMWLGISLKPSTIKFGALLNVTGDDKKIATSGRGPLVYNYLKSNDTVLEYIENLQKDCTYSAFNLCMIEISREKANSYHFSNSPQATYHYSGEQILAFGNSTPKTPFTKVKKGKERFAEIVETLTNKEELVKNLLELLKWQEKHLPDDELQRRAPEGIGFLSSVFVQLKNGGYGTRTHSIILIDHEFNVEFIEHTMKEPIDIDNPHWEVTTIHSHL